MKYAVLLMIVALTLLAVSGLALAQSGGGYDLTWNTIDNGGGTIENNGYTLNGTIGQSDAGVPISHGEYTLTGGFWAGVSSAQYRIYLPVVLRS